MDDIQRIWEEVSGRLQERITAASFRMWFADAHPVRLDDDGFELAVRSTFVQTWISERLLGVLSESLAEVVNAEVPVHVTVRAEGAERAVATNGNGNGNIDDPDWDGVERRGIAFAPVGETEAAEELAGQAAAQAGLNARYTFELFVIGESNRFAHATALAVAERPSESYNPLFIYGGVGLGKTHLLHAIGHYVLRHIPGKSVRYVTIEQFTNDFIDAIRDKRMEGFKRRHRDVDVLLVDDVQFIAGRGRTEEEFFHTFNALHEAGKQIVITSDRAPKDLTVVADRLRSRFEWGLLTDVRPPDIETRIAILRKKVHVEGLAVPDPDVLSYIAGGISSNIRELEGALTRLVAWASLSQVPVTLDLARTVLKDSLTDQAGRPVSIEVIIDTVCRFFGVTPYDLRSDKRHQRVVRPRQVAMYLARQLTDASYPQIAARFGGRDHTTVMHADRRIQRLLAEDRELYEQVEELTNMIRAHV